MSIRETIKHVNNAGETIEVPKYTIAEFIENVRAWGKRTCILTNGKTITQASKLLEETGELAGGICRNNRDKTLDAIGDQCFLVAMVTTLAGLEAEEVFNAGTAFGVDTHVVDSSITENDPMWPHYALHRFNIYFAMGVDEIVNAEFGLCDPAAALESAADFFVSAVTCLKYLSEYYNVGLEVPCSLVWDIVKDRKGRLTPEGAFIKSTDPEYFYPTQTIPLAELNAAIEKNSDAGTISIVARAEGSDGELADIIVPKVFADSASEVMIYGLVSTLPELTEEVRTQVADGHPVLAKAKSFTVVEVV